jgi:hypothetical protein
MCGGDRFIGNFGREVYRKMFTVRMVLIFLRK